MMKAALTKVPNGSGADLDKIRVFIVDDRNVAQAGLRQSSDQKEGPCVMGETEDGEVALGQLREIPADVTLVDMRTPGIDGIETLLGLRQRQPGVRVLVLTAQGQEYLVPAIEAGAMGYLLNRASGAQPAGATLGADQGEASPDPRATPGNLRYAQNPATRFSSPLSQREAQVLELIAAGRSNKEIAVELGLATQTIKNHVTNALGKLNATCRTHAVTMALRKGWIINPV